MLYRGNELLSVSFAMQRSQAKKIKKFVVADRAFDQAILQFKARLDFSVSAPVARGYHQKVQRAQFNYSPTRPILSS